jgi:RNA polymerase sigma-70 factor, ECF subfamily
VSTLALDHESEEWLRDLQSQGGTRELAVARLHELLLRISRGEAMRRRASMPDHAAEELDDICVHAANDALMAVLAKLDAYRGTARFTTWACKFVIFETSAALRRHAWRHRRVEPDETVWDRLPDTAPPILKQLESDQVMTCLRRAIDAELTERQRLIFQSVTLDDVPIDVLAERLGSTRGAIYKMLHDARGKLRRALTEAGHGELV